MKKLLFIVLATFAFACGDNNNANENDAAIIDEEVEIGAGEEISPQLELNDSANLEVDTILSATDINQ